MLKLKKGDFMAKIIPINKAEAIFAPLFDEKIIEIT